MGWKVTNKEKLYLAKAAGFSLRDVPEGERIELGLGSYDEQGESYHPMNIREHGTPRWFSKPFMSKTPNNMDEAIEETVWENMKEELLNASHEGRDPDAGILTGQFDLNDDFTNRMGLYLSNKYPDRYEATGPLSEEDREKIQGDYSEIVKERQDKEERT